MTDIEVVHSVEDANLFFTVYDYAVFGGMLGLSGLIGLYFGFISKRKQDNAEEYLMGSHMLKAIPVAISLTATQVSSVSMLGIPSEVYLYGTQYWAIGFALIIVSLALGFFFLPVFYDFQELTIYTYLEKRFDRRQRSFASAMYIINSVLYMPLMVYAPALALSQVTGINLHVITPAICLICIFYTMFGGIRAVVWADTIQFFSIICALIFVMVFGTYIVGGLPELLKKVDEGDRLIFFNLDLDPTVRTSFWMIIFGMPILYSGIQPEYILRFQSLPTYRDAIKCLILFSIGHAAIRISAAYCGCVIYARYQACDPYTLGYVKKIDQIFPYYVMDVAKNIPGIPGVFVAGVFSAGLSSMSTCLNSLAGCVHTDFLKRYYPKTSDKTDSNILKLIVFLIGILSIGMVMIVEKLGNIFSLGVSLNGICGGTLLGLFILGMAFPQANRYGALWGTIISVTVVTFLTMGAQVYIGQNKFKYTSKPFRTDGCDSLGYIGWQNVTGFRGNPNSTIYIENENFDSSDVPAIFKLGFMYYALIGTILVLVIGYPISKLTGGSENLDPRLLSPMVRSWYLRKQKKIDKEIEAQTLNNLIPQQQNDCDLKLSL